MNGIGSLLSGIANNPYEANKAGTKGKKIEQASAYDPEKDPLLMLQKGIKNFRDEHYTGLSDEDKEKIQEEIRKYLEALKKSGKDPENMTVEDAKAFQEFVESLRRKYGFKGGDDELEAMAAEAFGVTGAGSAGPVNKSGSALAYKFETEMKTKAFEDFDTREKEAKKSGVLF